MDLPLDALKPEQRAKFNSPPLPQPNPKKS